MTRARGALGVITPIHITMNANPTSDELHRLQKVREYRIMDTAPEAVFDELVELAAHIAATPIATLTFIDENRQWFKSCIGLPMRQTARSIAFCDYTIRAHDPLLIPDIRQDSRFANNPLVVGDPHLRFYAGFPLITADGTVIGTLTVMDVVARELSQEQIAKVQLIARQTMAHLEARLLAHREQALQAEMEKSQAEIVALHQTEVRFYHLFAHAAAGIAMAHLDGRYIDINPAYCAMAGYSEAQLLSMTFFEITHPDDAPRCEQMVRELAEEKIDNFVIEKRYIRGDGDIVWVWATISAVPINSGESKYLIAVTTDITEQKVMEERLKRSEAHLRELATRMTNTLESITDAFYTVDREWRFTYVNKEAEQLLMQSRVALMGRNLWEVFPQAVDTIFYDEFQRAVRDNVTVIFEGYYIPFEKWFDVRAYPSKDGLSVYFRDITEWRAALNALRTSEERFQIVARATNDAICDWDMVTNRVWWNEGIEKLFGYSRAELEADSESWTSHIHPDDRERIIHTNATLLLQGIDNWTEEYRFLRKDGSIAYVLDRGFVIRDSNGKAVRMVGSMVDLTARKRAEEALRESEEQYRLLFINNPSPMWVYEVESLRFLAVNDAAVAHYGYSRQEFLAMTLRDIRPPEDIPTLEKNVAAIVLRKDFGIWRHRKKDGTLIEVEVTSDAISFNGHVARIVMANDVTARRRAEEQVREQAALLDKAQDAIIVRDLEHRITFWNRSAERLFGWRIEEALGRRVDELLYRDTADFQAVHEQVMAAGEWIGEVPKMTRDDREILVESRWTLVRDDMGNPRSVLVIDTDITERKKLEAQFLRAQRMESIGTLAGGIAHDLNNVLAPIIMSLGMLRQKERTPSELRLLNILEESAQKGAAMVRQVLTFARGMEGERTIIYVDRTIRDLVRLIRDTFDRKIRVTMDLPDSLWPILGDPTQLHQLLLNLCVNARDAMPEGGELRLSAANIVLDAYAATLNPGSKAGQYVMLIVSDNGIGIPKTIRDRIFDPFFTTKEVGKGTGLGLATALAVAKGHDGFINVYSEEGRGTEFRIYLPATVDETSDDKAVVQTQLPRGRGELVLVVEDEERVRQVTQQSLEAFGYRVLVAENGADGLETYLQHRAEIDVVLTDMMMPVMDGLALIRALRKVNPAVKIIAASGLADNETVAKAANAGVMHFLPKPYALATLLGELAELLETSEIDTRKDNQMQNGE